MLNNDKIVYYTNNRYKTFLRRKHMYIKKLIDPDGYDQYYDIIVSDGVYDILCFGSWKIEKNSPFKLFCYFVDDMKNL